MRLPLYVHLNDLIGLILPLADPFDVMLTEAHVLDLFFTNE